MNYQYTSGRSQPRGGPMNDSRRRKRVYNYDEEEHIKKLHRERLYWEENEWRAPQQGFVVKRGRFEGPPGHMRYPPVSGRMGWLHAPPDPPKYSHMAPHMSRRQPPNVHQLHSYEYAPCHLNHPLFPKITQRQPVDMRGPKVPVQHHTWNKPAGHQPPQLDVDDLLSKLLNSGIIKLPQVPAPKKRLSQKSIDDLLAYLLSAGVIKAPHSDSTQTPRTAVQAEEEVPDLRDFSKTKMKQRYENVIQELYTETQCSQCALRFKQSDQYKEHLESHKNSTPRKNRSWYASINEWIKHNPKEAGEEMTPIGDPEEPDSIRDGPLR